MKKLLILLIMALMLTSCQRPDLSTVKCSQELFKGGFSYEDVPEYSGEPYAELNGGVPYFTKDEITDQAFERYSKRDALGRCHEAVACISRELMPDMERGSIGMVKPAGWHTVKYDCIDGRYLYNICKECCLFISKIILQTERQIKEGTGLTETEGTATQNNNSSELQITVLDVGQG